MNLIKIVLCIVGFITTIIVKLAGRKLANKYGKDLYSWGCFAGMIMYFFISITIDYLMGIY